MDQADRKLKTTILLLRMKVPAKDLLTKGPGIQSQAVQQIGRAQLIRGHLTNPVQAEIMVGLITDQVLADLTEVDILVADLQVDLKVEQVQVGLQEEVLRANSTRKLTDDLITNRIFT